MSIIKKKKKREKGGRNQKKRGRKTIKRKLGFFFPSPRYRNGFCSKNFFRPAMVRIGNESCLCMHRKWIIQLFERAPITESVFHFETFIGVDLFSPVVPRLRAVNRQQNLFRGRKYTDGQWMTTIRSEKFNNWINFFFSPYFGKLSSAFLL